MKCRLIYFNQSHCAREAEIAFYCPPSLMTREKGSALIKKSRQFVLVVNHYEKWYSLGR